MAGAEQRAAARQAADVVQLLAGQASEVNRAGQARFGIKPRHSLGVPVRAIREVARTTSRDRELVQALWQTGVHEARILASMIADPAQVRPEDVDIWTEDFDSWDIVDQFCQNLYWKLPFAATKAEEYSRRSEEYVKRTGFALAAAVARRGAAGDQGALGRFIELAVEHGADDRNYVKKAVSWFLREVATRHPRLQSAVLEACQRLAADRGKGGRWIAADVRRELRRKGLMPGPGAGVAQSRNTS